MAPFIYLTLLLALSGPVVPEHDWSYHKHNGPHEWKHWFPLCGSHSQSPIDIVSKDAIESSPWTPFVFENYNVHSTSMILFNNGHTAGVEAVLPSPATVKGGGLEDEYAFHQFHFHWGSDDTKGSEHNVDGKKYPAELHMVHYNTKYVDAGDAMQHEDGLAVLGIFLEIESKDNTDLDSVINGLADIHTTDTKTEIAPFPLEDLLPEDVDHFYRYQGSLTTPTCDEIVTWTVFKETTKISFSQIAKFRELLDHDGDALVDNFRPVQPLHHREVYDSNLP